MELKEVALLDHLEHIGDAMESLVLWSVFANSARRRFRMAVPRLYLLRLQSR